MKKHYETVFILTPVLSEQQTKDAVTKFEQLLNDLGADIYHSEHWGLKKLAYPISHKTTGVYHLFEFKAEPSLIGKLELEYKRDEQIMRFLTVSLDKYAVEYNERRRKYLSNKKSTETKEEAAS